MIHVDYAKFVEWLETINYCIVVLRVSPGTARKTVALQFSLRFRLWKSTTSTFGTQLGLCCFLVCIYQICIDMDRYGYSRLAEFYHTAFQLEIFIHPARKLTTNPHHVATQWIECTTSGGDLLPTIMASNRQDLLTVADVSHNAHNATPRWLHSDGWQFSKHLHLLKNYTSHACVFRHFLLNVQIEWCKISILTTIEQLQV